MAEVHLVVAAPSTPDKYLPDLGSEVRNFLPRLAHLRIMVDDEQVGEVIFYNADLTNGTAWLSVGFDEAHRRTVLPWHGVLAALEWVFDVYELRMVYVEALEHLAHQFRRAERDGIMVEIGRLPAAWWHVDHYEDMVNYVIERKTWEAAAERYRDRLRRLESRE